MLVTRAAGEKETFPPIIGITRPPMDQRGGETFHPSCKEKSVAKPRQCQPALLMTMSEADCCLSREFAGLLWVCPLFELAFPKGRGRLALRLSVTSQCDAYRRRQGASPGRHNLARMALPRFTVTTRDVSHAKD